MNLKRNKDWYSEIKAIATDFSNHLYGAVSVFGLFFTIAFAVYTFNKPTIEFKDVLYLLLFCNAFFCIIIFRYAIKYSNLQKQSSDIFVFQRDNKNLKVLLKLMAETFHNITHYYRSFTFDLDNIISKIDSNQEITQDEINHLCERNNHFLVMLTSSLQNYYSIHTDDNCSITIKLISPDTKKIKTLFRDPVNLKKRRQVEIMNNIETYNTNDNTAFSIILDKNLKDTYFACDNLKELHYNLKYKNCNDDWSNYYNATLVMPISKNNNSLNQRHIVGFISVDNMNGSLIDSTTIELFQAVSDLLYNYVLKFEKITTFTIINNLKNDKENEFKIRN